MFADNSSAAPAHPKQSQLAAEAIRAAQHFGNTTAASNDNAQYVIATAGITIVGGHEAAETMTDQFPNGGWLDSSGAEIGDKCAWIPTGSQGASQAVSFSSGSFAVQSLWSNAFNVDVGGCVVTYP